MCERATYIPWSSPCKNHDLFRQKRDNFASSGNRTRAARVAGEHSTTEPTMLSYVYVSKVSPQVCLFQQVQK